MESPKSSLLLHLTFFLSFLLGVGRGLTMAASTVMKLGSSYSERSIPKSAAGDVGTISRSPRLTLATLIRHLAAIPDNASCKPCFMTSSSANPFETEWIQYGFDHCESPWRQWFISKGSRNVHVTASSAMWIGGEPPQFLSSPEVLLVELIRIF
jgi:hypothetical protein